MKKLSPESARPSHGCAAAARVIAAAVLVFCASCALDTAGTLQVTPDVPVDLPPDGIEIDVFSEEMPDDPPPEIEPYCTPGEPCPGGRYCCNIGGSLGCYETALDCDCGISDVICTSQGMACCETEPGVRKCKPDMQSCLCSWPEDSAMCGDGKICCARESGGQYACTSEREGCLCSIADPAVAAYCGEGRVCCVTGDSSRCTADISTCRCSNPGDDPAECGTDNRYCCTRGAGMTCGDGPAGCICTETGDPICTDLACCDRDSKLQCVTDPEGCPCTDLTDCAAGYVCCSNWYSSLNKYCRASACYCRCEDMPAGDCKFLGEDMVCRLGQYCDLTWGCW